MTIARMKGAGLFGFSWLAILILYFATTAGGEEEFRWVVFGTCEWLPLLLPAAFAISGFQYPGKVDGVDGVERTKTDALQSWLSFFNALASIMIAFILASVLRDALMTRAKFADWSISMDTNNWIAFTCAALLAAGVAATLNYSDIQGMGRALNGAASGALAGAAGMYGFLLLA